MGANASLGKLTYPNKDRNNCVMLGIGLDMTFPVTDLISVGGYVELNTSGEVGFAFTLNTSGEVGFAFTPTVMFSFPNNSAILLGLGYRGTDQFHHNGFLMRAAYKLSNPWYITASYSVGHGNTVMLGPQPIITCSSGDESASTLADRLNKIK